MAGFHLDSLSADLPLVNRARAFAPGLLQQAWRIVLRKNDAPSRVGPTRTGCIAKTSPSIKPPSTSNRLRRCSTKPGNRSGS